MTSGFHSVCVPSLLEWDGHRGTYACRRDEIASCSERAYKQLSVPEAQKLMLFTSAKEALQFAEQVCGHYRLLLIVLS